ncbi:hypothetical protein [Streptomyces sp. DH37]|uniref:hypothetical protein n=1 Tax=Streptomyces sp. DH37 TaxID=3040122 RepID=UPI002441B580|nr:hypothetical protein [Streptomyces sp. DH37]MDG9702320.1 hypothetical protein [Streptomyces sp. DH37]
MPVPQPAGGVHRASAGFDVSGGPDVPEVAELAEFAEFAAALTALTAVLDPAAGWYGVFARRDPEGLAACLAGRRLPPWDVVASLLDDLTARHGPRRARPRAAWLRALHQASVAAHDRAAGDPRRRAAELRDRLAATVREQRHAAHREQALARALVAGGHPAGADRLAADLAWARDDRARATARCRELRERLAALEAGAGGVPEPAAGSASVPPAGSVPRPGSGAGHGPPPPSAPVRPRPRGARFAGLETGPQGAPAAAPVPAPATADPAVPAPRGARFAGVRDDGTGRREAPPETEERDRAARTRRECDAVVARLAGLRARGRGGEAHALLCEAARGPAPRLPVLAERLERAGMAAEVAGLLWEAAGLPPGPLAEAAGALAAAGRAEDCGRLLRQGAARPSGEVAATALALYGAGRGSEAVELLSAVVRARRPEEAAEVVAADPAALTPLLLAAAARVSDRRRGDIEGLLARGREAAPDR